MCARSSSKVHQEFTILRNGLPGKKDADISCRSNSHEFLEKGGCFPTLVARCCGGCATLGDEGADDRATKVAGILGDHQSMVFSREGTAPASQTNKPMVHVTMRKAKAPRLNGKGTT